MKGSETMKMNPHVLIQNGNIAKDIGTFWASGHSGLEYMNLLFAYIFAMINSLIIILVCSAYTQKQKSQKNITKMGQLPFVYLTFIAAVVFSVVATLIMLCVVFVLMT